MRQQVWRKSGASYYIDEDSNTEKRLPRGVFTVEYDTQRGVCFLKQLSEAFEFPYKVYGLNSEFIERVDKTYKNTTSNLGILLNGVRGTGKTVTAQMIANNIGNPIIIVSNNYEEKLINFINGIDQDVVIFVDEYEKVFEKSKHLLTVMDGVFNNSLSRKAFILTTNNTWVEENLLQRTGRIRYLKEFGNMESSVVKEVIEDLLNDKKYEEELLDLISKLDLVTIDIVKALIQEINIHDKSANNLFKDMNVKKKEPSACSTTLFYKGEKIGTYHTMNKSETKKYYNTEPGDDFAFKGMWIGSVHSKNEDGTFLVQLDTNRPLIGVKEIDDMMDVTDENPKVYGEYYNQKEGIRNYPYVTVKFDFEEIKTIYAF